MGGRWGRGGGWKSEGAGPGVRMGGSGCEGFGGGLEELESWGMRGRGCEGG